jgi:fructose-specific phosphotransferase system IIC component
VKEDYVSNSIAKSLSAIGWFFIIGGIVAGFIAGIKTETVVSYFTKNMNFQWTVAIVYWVVSLVSGVLMLGVAEIINLLERLYAKLK